MTDTKNHEKIIEPSAARLVESLRDTGYTFNTSVADIVDNSVSADANQIDIILDIDFGNNPYLMIADNGTGMDESELESAMMYGSPLRPNPKSLGKFGMGLKTASTSFCRKLTVISCKDGKHSIRQWDLDKISELNKWILLKPSTEDYEDQIDFLSKIRKEGNGTIVIWENIDRLIRSDNHGNPQKQLEKPIEDLKDHLSGVFFNFLNNQKDFGPITINVNRESLIPWDPFCRWLNENEKRVDIHEEKPFKISETIDGEDKEIGEFRLNVYVLPNKRELTKEEIERSRFSLDNQGFHVFREGRMIFSGGWPNRLFVKESHLNLIRVELLFDHKLDHHFQIDIKKSRIDLPKDLRDKLKKVLTPARNEAQKRYRGKVNNSKSNVEQLNNQHIKSSTALDKYHDSTTSGSQIMSFDKKTGEAKIENKFGRTTLKIRSDNNPLLVNTKETLTDGVLWEAGLVDNNKHAVFLNKSHQYYKKFYQANKDNSTLIYAMDSLLWSLAEAELCVYSSDVKRNLEDMRFSVSKSLRTLAEELPDIEEGEI